MCPCSPLLDAADDRVTVTAIDGYAVTMTRAELANYGALFATSLNGERMTEEDFGRLWLNFFP